MERVSYLTSKNKSLQIDMAELGKLVKYARENYIPFLKFNLAIIGLFILIFGILALPLVLLVLCGDPCESLKAVVPIIVLVAIAAAAVIISVVFGTARILFFMGNENAGVRRLLENGWRIFTSNAVEYALFGIAYISVTLAYVAANMAISFIPCMGAPVSMVLSLAFSFAAGVLFFVFIPNLTQHKKIKNKQDNTSSAGNPGRTGVSNSASQKRSSAR